MLPAASTSFTSWPSSTAFVKAAVVSVALRLIKASLTAHASNGMRHVAATEFVLCCAPFRQVGRTCKDTRSCCMLAKGRQGSHSTASAGSPALSRLAAARCTTIGPTRPRPRVQPPPSSLMPTGPFHCRKGPLTFITHGLFSMIGDHPVNSPKQTRLGFCVVVCEPRISAGSMQGAVVVMKRPFAFRTASLA